MRRVGDCAGWVVHQGAARWVTFWQQVAAPQVLQGDAGEGKAAFRQAGSEMRRWRAAALCLRQGSQGKGGVQWGEGGIRQAGSEMWRWAAAAPVLEQWPWGTGECNGGKQALGQAGSKMRRRAAAAFVHGTGQGVSEGGLRQAGSEMRRWSAADLCRAFA